MRHRMRTPTCRPPQATRPALLAITSILAGGGMLSTGVVAETDRAGDRLSAAAFREPPVNARPGSFWDWLNGSITKEQITRDLTAMKQAGMRGGEIWDVAAYADPDRRVLSAPTEVDGGVIGLIDGAG